MDKTKLYDAVFYTHAIDRYGSKYHLFCCIFESYVVNNNYMDVEIPYHLIKVTEEMRTAGSKPLYCGNEHGIIQENYGDLYQFKLQTFDHNKEHQFEKLEVNIQDNIWSNW